MKRFFLIGLLIFFYGLFLAPKLTFAIEDPLALPNNKIGIHILFTSELDAASKLINSSGGDWGYVVIPIQAGDRDMEKWQEFMNSAKLKHVVPIIRLATEGDYFHTSDWKKPSESDVVDFANFLNSLEWPVKNRYIVAFNEVNRSDEWEGSPNPSEYARILSFTVATFKSLSPDFFIISAGLDNASANTNSSMNEYDFMNQMNQAIPGIFNLIDGLGSHSYPNPAFSVAPWIASKKSISSFQFERNLAYSLSYKKLPVFITETGWSKDKLSANQIASYFQYAFQFVWSDDNVVAVTPFILWAGKPFSQFSLINEDGSYNEIYLAIQNIPKIKGNPTINRSVNSSIDSAQNKDTVPRKTFPPKIQYADPSGEKADFILNFFKWLLKFAR